MTRMHTGVYDTVWRSAMRIDHLFGSVYDASAYQKVTGSVSPIFLWDEFDGFRPRLRFNVDLPLPQLNERFNAFIGRVNRDEYVDRTVPTRRLRCGGSSARRAMSRRFSEFPIAPRPSRAHASTRETGVRLVLPMDPCIKGQLHLPARCGGRHPGQLPSDRFWQASEQFGTTTRFDLEGLVAGPWLVRWANSATITQESRGVRGFTSLTGLRGFPNRRSFAIAIGLNGESGAEVPLQDYGIRPRTAKASRATGWCSSCEPASTGRGNGGISHGPPAGGSVSALRCPSAPTSSSRGR